MSDDKTAKRSKRATTETGTDASPADRDVGQALRSVYAKAVNEDIPSELLDLLGKLS